MSRPSPKTATGMQRAMANEDQMRNELFAGRRDDALTNVAANGGAPSGIQRETDGMTVDQLVQKAARTHQDTTTTAQRALKVVEQSRQVQAATLTELEQQNQRIQAVDEKLHKIKHELTYSERLLRYMARCCCCWMCDCCTNADPERESRNDWKKRVDKGQTVASANRAGQPPPGPRPLRGKAAKKAKKAEEAAAAQAAAAAAAAAEAAAARAAGWRDPDIRLTEQHRNTEMAMNAETRKQNEILDQIHNGLGDLLEGARRIGGEVQSQGKALDRLQGRTDHTTDRIEDMNTKSQLREFRVKKP